MKHEDNYYLRYDDRYRRVHSRGFDRWISSPEENTGVIKSIDGFLEYAGGSPAETSVIEFGCGEGFIAAHLLSLGYRYLGLDISESAIRKAREYTGTAGENSFMPADVVNDLRLVAGGSFDVAIDNQCLHMLVTDDHRRKYLDGVKRILKSGGRAFFRENVQEEEFTQNIADFQDWLEKTGNDYSALHDYPAYKDNRRHTVSLPRVPARFNNETGYRREFEEAGFRMEHFESDGRMCIMYTAAV